MELTLTEQMQVLEEHVHGDRYYTVPEEVRIWTLSPNDERHTTDGYGRCHCFPTTHVQGGKMFIIHRSRSGHELQETSRRINGELVVNPSLN